MDVREKFDVCEFRMTRSASAFSKASNITVKLPALREYQDVNVFPAVSFSDLTSMLVPPFYCCTLTHVKTVVTPGESSAPVPCVCSTQLSINGARGALLFPTSARGRWIVGTFDRTYSSERTFVVRGRAGETVSTNVINAKWHQCLFKFLYEDILHHRQSLRYLFQHRWPCAILCSWTCVLAPLQIFAHGTSPPERWSGKQHAAFRINFAWLFLD